jgi:excisionase family DNA binding protein
MPADTLCGRRLEGVDGKLTMNLDRKTVSIPRACELVGVSRRTIYNWISGGKVQYVRTAGGSVRIFEDTLWRNGDNTANADERERQWAPTA